VIRVECLQLAGSADEAFRPDPVVSPEGIARLVDALVRAQSGVILERRSHPGEDLLPGGSLLARGARRQVRDLAEVQPALEPLRSGRVELGTLNRDLLVELP
jgi:hypothetical protein